MDQILSGRSHDDYQGKDVKYTLSQSNAFGRYSVALRGEASGALGDAMANVIQNLFIRNLDNLQKLHGLLHVDAEAASFVIDMVSQVASRTPEHNYTIRGHELTLCLRGERKIDLFSSGHTSSLEVAAIATHPEALRVAHIALGLFPALPMIAAFDSIPIEDLSRDIEEHLYDVKRSCSKLMVEPHPRAPGHTVGKIVYRMHVGVT
jgi:hypothetical protein